MRKYHLLQSWVYTRFTKLLTICFTEKLNKTLKGPTILKTIISLATNYMKDALHLT